MSKEEKRNILVAAVLSVGAVIVLWWMRHQGPVVYTQDPNAEQVGNTTGPANPAYTPQYMAYNVPPYNPGDLPPIAMQAYGGNNASTYGGNRYATDNSTGKGCCPGCAGDDSVGNSNSITQYLSLMGLGGLAGAA